MNTNCNCLKGSIIRFIIGIALVVFYHLTGFAGEMNPAKDLNNPEYLTTEEWRLAEDTIGNPDSDSYDEEAFEGIIKKALESPLLNEADKLRAGYRLEIISKNRVGSVAADFSFKTRDGSVKSLYTIEFPMSFTTSPLLTEETKIGTEENGPVNSGETASVESEDRLSGAAKGKVKPEVKTEILPENVKKPILLLFYDPDCGHCIETIEELKKTDLVRKLEILAIDAEEDYELWQRTSAELPEEWTVGFALDPIQDDDIYIFLSSPTLYLLSPEKRILLKDTNLSKISAYLNNR